VVLLFVAGACGVGAADLDRADLAGVWVLKSMEAGGRSSVIEAGRNTAKLPYVEIGDRLQGSYGCNDFGGSYSIDGGTIVPGDVGGHLLLCLGPEGTDPMYAEDQLRPMLHANLPIVVKTDGDEMTWASIGRTLTFARVDEVPAG
jgi:heat shock protein HslJ